MPDFCGAGASPTFIPAGRLGVRQPTVTDPVIALERKSLVRRQADPADARATAKVTPPALAQPADAVPSLDAAALANLSEAEQLSNAGQAYPQPATSPYNSAAADLHHMQILPVEYDSETAASHHFVFVDAPFGKRALRLDPNMSIRKPTAFLLGKGDIHGKSGEFDVNIALDVPVDFPRAKFRHAA